MKTAKTSLPDSDTVCRLLMALAPPYDVMAWLMVETAARVHDVQALRIGDLRPESRVLKLPGECGVRDVVLSEGLADALNRFREDLLRPAFAWLERENRRNAKRGPGRFAAQRFFPAWLLDGNGTDDPDVPISTEDATVAWRAAAKSVGYYGPIHSNTLRLFAAKARWEQGSSIQELHDMLGHRDLMTTLLLVQSLDERGLRFAGAPSHSDGIAHAA
ncbi:MAG TPA: tyrosine-type recombinase/integrase [Kiritimatiellia bacterium]|nr:tyrosine-type recombinase/integrase [Kiritimatiellia bacterium]HMO98526.1 tyrosine-type recombinase/integrase [Kiritimatiellia bacterium]HMP97715.1 tyrosine-type recombinase/integrase [Kiritimatiellia bacterium]